MMPEASVRDDRTEQSTQTTTAERVAREWLALTDRGDAQQSWQQAASLFQRAVTPEQWARSLSTVREPLGALIERKLETAKPATELPGAPDGHYVVLTFQTSFVHKRSATETVTPMREDDGSWHVAGYYVR
jgi:Protein of unknown function (DUF4019)